MFSMSLRHEGPMDVGYRGSRYRQTPSAVCCLEQREEVPDRARIRRLLVARGVLARHDRIALLAAFVVHAGAGEMRGAETVAPARAHCLRRRSAPVSFGVGADRLPVTIEQGVLQADKRHHRNGSRAVFAPIAGKRIASHWHNRSRHALGGATEGEREHGAEAEPHRKDPIFIDAELVAE